MKSEVIFYIIVICLFLIPLVFAEIPQVPIGTQPITTTIIGSGGIPMVNIQTPNSIVNYSNNFTNNITNNITYYVNLTTTCASGYVLQNISNNVGQCVLMSAGGGDSPFTNDSTTIYQKNISLNVLLGNNTEDGTKAKVQIQGTAIGPADVQTGTAQKIDLGSGSFTEGAGGSFDFYVYAYQTLSGTTYYSSVYKDISYADNIVPGEIQTINQIPDSAGTGYVAGDNCTIFAGYYNARVYIDSVDGSGGITQVTLTFGGVGYSVGVAQLGCDNSGNNDATIEITSITPPAGQILTLNPVPDNIGTGYTAGADCSVYSGNYDAMIHIDSVDINGGITGFTLASGGSGYTVSGNNPVQWCNMGGNNDATVQITSVVVVNTYNVGLSWDAVPNADGYKLIIYDSLSGYYYDKSIVTSSNSLTYNGTGVTTDVTIAPASSFMGLSVHGNSIFDGRTSFKDNLNLNDHYINNGVDWSNSILIGPGAGNLATRVSFSNCFGQDSCNSADVHMVNALGGNSAKITSNLQYSNCLGMYACANSINGFSNNMLGSFAGQSSNVQSSNCQGDQSCYNMTGTSDNVVGTLAGSNLVGDNNNIFGKEAGKDSTTSSSNLFGEEAGVNAINTVSSNFFGTFAGFGSVSSLNNNFFGTSAGRGSTAVTDSNYFGNNAGYGTDTSGNNFFGPYAGKGATGTGYSNFIGQYAGQEAEGSSYSNFFGQNTGYLASGSSYSNFIGYYAGYGANASSSIFIGKSAGRTYGVSNTLIIDNSITSSDQPRTSLSAIQNNSLLYGVFANAWQNQSLRINVNNLTIPGDLDIRDLTVNGNTVFKGNVTFNDTYWDDMDMPLLSSKIPTVNAPSLTAFRNTTYAYAFSDQAVAGNQEEIYSSIQMSHSYKLNTTVYCHLHWTCPTTSANNVTWGLEYSKSDIGGVYPTSTTTIRTSPCGTAYTSNLIELGNIGNFTGLSGTGQFRLFRASANATDTYTGSAYAISIDCHYQKDTIGSREEYLK